ncbi:hypothetical protein CLF_105850, partial [Clonorchis sinensis]
MRHGSIKRVFFRIIHSRDAFVVSNVWEAPVDLNRKTVSYCPPLQSACLHSKHTHEVAVR